MTHVNLLYICLYKPRTHSYTNHPTYACEGHCGWAVRQWRAARAIRLHDRGSHAARVTAELQHTTLAGGGQPAPGRPEAMGSAQVGDVDAGTHCGTAAAPLVDAGTHCGTAAAHLRLPSGEALLSGPRGWVAPSKREILRSDGWPHWAAASRGTLTALRAPRRATAAGTRMLLEQRSHSLAEQLQRRGVVAGVQLERAVVRDAPG